MTPYRAGSKTKDSPDTGAAQDLRRRAEALAAETATERPENVKELSPDVARRALHELRVHQIELEMQNQELRRAQEELEESRARYFDLYDLAPVGYFTVNEQGVILDANLTAANLLGVAISALVKQHLSRFILPADQDIYHVHRKALLNFGHRQAWELRMMRKDADPFWARVEATASKGAGDASLFRAVVSDITAKKLDEKERERLEVQNRQLQKAEGLGRMAGAIAHHFNNHLTAVIGNLELAIGKEPRDSRSTEMLNDAMLAASRAATVSKLMLTYLGQTQARHDSLDLTEVCRRSLPLLKATLPNDAVLHVNLPDVGPIVTADANQIQQVLTNLVTNAWEAGTSGCSIFVTVRTVAKSEIAPSHSPVDWEPRENSYACLEVTDTGGGIPAKDIEKLFDPFFSTKFSGRGLGLAVVLGIVRSHGGGVTVETRLGSGSTFRVFLPLSGEEVSRQQEESGPEIQWCGTMLLVEDDEMVRKVAETALTSFGFTVLQARDGIEAVEVFRQQKDQIRCVLCDLSMPRMNGWQTLEALRKLTPGVPVILASGYDKAQVMAGDHAELPHAFLSKPYQFNGLRNAIALALGPVRKPGIS